MRFQLILAPAARTDFERLELSMRERVVVKLRWFLANDVAPEPLEGNLKGLYKLRVGEYRIVYEFASDTDIVVRSIRHRSKAYEALARD